MKKIMSFVHSIVSAFSTESSEVNMDPNKDFIKQMCFVYQEVKHTNFNEPIFSKILDKDVQEKFMTLKKHLKSDLFNAVINFEKNKKVINALSFLNENIKIIFEQNQCKKIEKYDLIKLGVFIEKFYATFFDLNIAEYIALVRTYGK
ncbi:MAG: hypothetical protein FADNKDHG_01355 [Holosporales bacterium]